MDGRNGEITVDLVLQARAKRSDNKVYGPEEAVVSEMIEQLALEKIFIVMRCFSRAVSRVRWRPSSWKIVKVIFLRKPDAESKKKGSEATGPLRSHRYFRSGKHLVLCFV